MTKPCAARDGNDKTPETAAERQKPGMGGAKKAGGKKKLVSGLTFGHFAGARSDNRTKSWCQF
jgi:hypothetical protein